MNRRHPPSIRRAFTLLEVTLASVIASAVMGVCFALFLFFDRADTKLAQRFDQVSQLSRLRLVSERAFQTLLVSEEPDALRRARQRRQGMNSSNEASNLDLNNVENQARSAPAGGTGSKGAAATPGAASSNEPAARTRADDEEINTILATIPPRLQLAILREDRVESPDLDAEESNQPAVNARQFTTVPQRLELVLSTSPVPTQSELDDVEALMKRVELQRAREARRSKRDEAKGNSTDLGVAVATPIDAADEAEFDPPPLRSVRGAFELHPMPPRRGVPRTTPAWEVWWVPLERVPGPEESDEESPEPPGEPFMVASDIAFIRWQVFQGRARQQEYVARLQADLPAYIELEVETVGGLKANWLFEVGWSVGSEGRKLLVASASGTPNGSSTTTPNTPGANPTANPVNPGTPPTTRPTVSPLPDRPARPLGGRLRDGEDSKPSRRPGPGGIRRRGGQ